MILVGQHPTDLRHCHPFINQQRFGGSVFAKDLDEDLLDRGLFDLLDGQTDLLCFDLRGRVLRALGQLMSISSTILSTAQKSWTVFHRRKN